MRNVPRWAHKPPRTLWFIPVTVIAATAMARYIHRTDSPEPRVLARSSDLVRAVTGPDVPISLVALECRDLSHGEKGRMWLVQGDDPAGEHTFQIQWRRDGDRLQEIGHRRRTHSPGGRPLSVAHGAIRADYWLWRLGLVPDRSIRPNVTFTRDAVDTLSYHSEIGTAVVQITLDRCDGDLVRCRVEHTSAPN